MAPKALPLIFILIGAVTVCFCKRQPNFVFILTDDQDIFLGGSMTPITKTRNHFAENGMIFENAFTHIPICCPSRASILTGRYQHNHHVLNNSWEGDCDSNAWKQNLEPLTFAKYLQDAGYKTFMAGKYLNMYALDGDHRVPVGWDDWHGLVGNSVYYNYNLSVNGVPEVHGDKAEDYLTDVIHQKGIDYLKSDKVNTHQPFFVMLSTPASHYPYTPSNKYLGAFSGRTAPRTPNFEKRSDTKHWLVRQAPEKFEDSTIKLIDETFRNRWETLLSVDDMVDDVISTLREKGLLDNTYICYFSDHGYHLGQFGLPIEKMELYETDIRVPFMVSGPGIKPGLIRKEPVVSYDLAPTFLDLAGVKFNQRSMDGKSLVPLLKSETEDVASDWRTSFLIEYSGTGIAGPTQLCPQYGTYSGLYICFPQCICEDGWNNTYSCLRWLDVPGKKNMIFCAFDDSEDYVEVYDIQADPYQMNNLAHAMDDRSKSSIRFILKELTESDHAGLKLNAIEEAQSKLNLIDIL